MDGLTHTKQLLNLLCIVYIDKHVICLKDYRIRSFLSIHYVHGDLCKHLGIYSSTDHPDWYWNLFLNAYISCHVHSKRSRFRKYVLFNEATCTGKA